MLIVLDTNVLVSALLNPFGAPGRVLDLILAEQVRLAYDDRILAEYQRVLERPRFGFDPRHVRQLLDYLIFSGEAVSPLPFSSPEGVPDPADLPFAEVARSAKADALVTGNREHFRFLSDVPVFSPAEFLVFWSEHPKST